MFGLSVFADDEDRRRFLYLLGEVSARFPLRCHAYCLMGTHYHLILECRTATLAPAMRRLNGRYAQRFNLRHDRTGHVWGGRYSSYVIETETHLSKALEYIAANPVEAGLCNAVEDWPWTWIAAADEHGSRGRVPVPALAVMGS
jgi:REP-associated tyrosine transposase